MKLKNILLTALLAGAAMALASSARATIIGSEHDFTPTGSAGKYSTNGYAIFKLGGSATVTNACQVCHIPHKAAPYSSAKAPLWNHALSANTYVTYDQAGSVTFNALNLSVSLGSSTACLSCHDGSVAINQTYGNGGTTNYTGGTAVYAPSWAVEAIGGTDLTRMHPVGVSYSQALAADPELVTPASGSVLATAMLKGNAQSVECASCHDIHRTQGVSASAPDNLIVDVNGSQLCLTCHNK
ncbi:MAG TPA: hypothetical protein VFV23_00350 [Verrucomicrobiae bacterium]|nr:hypothetical protein [Verrucomicrobiae bacterium]